MRRRATLLLMTLAALGGCALVPFDPTPDPEAGPGFSGDCTPPFVLHEETTLGALELEQFADLGVDLTRRGTVRITEGTIRWEDYAPPDVPAIVPEGQLLCVTWADGSGMSTLLHEPFGRPRIDLGAGGGAGGPPMAFIGSALVVLLVGAISWLAFRREGRPRGG